MKKMIHFVDAAGTDEHILDIKDVLYKRTNEIGLSSQEIADYDGIMLIRSKKIEALKTNPIASLLFYDKEEKIQLRIIGKTKINYQNNITKKSWNNTTHMSRQCYLGDKAPGSNTVSPTSGLTEEIDNHKYTIEESEIGYKNFCVVEIFIESIEWLYLAARGHRRAYFTLKNSSVEKKWLIP